MFNNFIHIKQFIIVIFKIKLIIKYLYLKLNELIIEYLYLKLNK